MRLQAAFLAMLFAVAAPSGAGSMPVTQDLLVGTWKCDTVAPMKGPGFVLELLYVVEYAPDLTFVTTSTSKLTATGKSAIALVDTARGSWRLEGTTILWTYKEVKFISSSDPKISVEMGQKVHDDQFRKKPTGKSAVLEFDRQSMRIFPVEAEYPDAMVGTKCVRVSDAGGKRSQVSIP